MCEFISWKEVERDGKIYHLHLDDKELFSERNREILKGSKDNDFLGHHAIDEVYGLNLNEGRQGELREFWETNRLPRELQPKLKDFKAFRKNFGKMIETYAQRNDLEYIIRNSPEDKNKKWKGLKEFCRRALFRQILPKVKQETLQITIRRDLSINELIEATKFNGYVNPNVNDENFSEKKGKPEKEEAILLDLGTSVSTETVIAVMDHLNLEAGGPKELLSLSLDHPQRQETNPLVALRKSWRDPDGDRGVPCLSSWDGERELHLYWLEYDWYSYCLFLAFRRRTGA